MKKLVGIIRLLYDYGVNIVSVYFSSSQNFKRHVAEIDAFCKAEAEFCSCYFTDVANVYQVRVNRIGNRELTPGYLMHAVSKLEGATASYTSRSLNLCIAYNPFEELSSAINKSSDPSEFLANLWVPVPLDLVIRTGGASLLSNFLLLQAGFARLHVIDKLFNDLMPEDVVEVLSDFGQIQRIYGE